MAKAFLSGLKAGALHKTLGVKKGSKIPSSKLKIKKGMSTLEKRRIQFAINAKKFKHGSKKSKGYDFGKAEKKLGTVE